MRTVAEHTTEKHEGVARASAGPAPQRATAGPDPLLAASSAGHCACGGGCPGCQDAPTLRALRDVSSPDGPLEVEAERFVDEVLRTSTLQATSGFVSDSAEGEVEAVPERTLGSGPAMAAHSWPGARGSPVGDLALAAFPLPGRPLDPGLRAYFEPRLGFDLGPVRIHTDEGAAEAAATLGAKAFTLGPNIGFARGHYAPSAEGGRRLLAHELAHVDQQRRSGRLFLARSAEDWLQSTPLVAPMPYTELLLEADELQQWLDRQTSSSADTARIEEALASIRREIASRDAQALIAGRRPPHARRRASVAAPLPDRRPDVLSRLGSVSYTDPAAMRAEYDLIMQWLAHEDLPRNERDALETERATLAPLLQGERQRAAGQRSAARLQLALTPAQSEEGAELAGLASIIEGITVDPADPELFYLYDRGERVPISAAQRDSLSTTLSDQLSRAQRLMSGRVDYAWGRYESQKSINADHPVVSRIAGWMGGVSDPGVVLARRVAVARAQLEGMRLRLRRGAFHEAASMLPLLERDTQIITAVSRAFYEGYIEGAEGAVTVLEFTRDASFAVATSIGVVVAAPFVAGAVAGAGFTGVTATGLTTLGTGTVVGTGTGLLRGGSAAAGITAAGGSADEALAALRSEGTRGAVEGFLAGGGGAAARALAPALGVGANVGGQFARRTAAEAIVNSASAVIDALANGASIEQAARAGVTAALLSVPGAAVGGNSQLSRRLLGPITSSATAYVGAIANGASPEEARRAATVVLVSALASGHITEGRQAEEAGLYQRGQQAGRTARRTVVATTAAAMIGSSTAEPALRQQSGEGAPSLVAPPGSGHPAMTDATLVADATRVPGTASQMQAQAPAAESPAVVTRAAIPSAGTEQVSPATARAASPRADASAATPAAAYQQVSVAPNVEAELGITASRRSAIRSAFGGDLASQTGAPLGTVWDRVANPGEAATLTAANSRRLFNNHRRRFWRAVRRDPAALRVIRDMGGTFREERNGGRIDPNATSIPEINLPDGTRLPISLDHKVERQTAPNVALDPSNLRLSTLRENTVLLRQQHEQDPFINPPSDWTPFR